jgi:septal ring factor EnvC (AmiA/AmiB activator)
MNTWQEWVTILVGAIVTFLIGSHQQEKNRRQREKEAADKKLEETEKRLQSLAERTIKLESEVVSDKEVREILKEFFLPFMTTLGEIQKDIEVIKIKMAERDGQAKEHRE